MLGVEQRANITITEGLDKLQTKSSKPLQKLPQVAFRLCKKCWSLTQKGNLKSTPRSCKKCGNRLKVVFPGCCCELTIESSYKHVGLCKKYSMLYGQATTNFDLKVEGILKAYLEGNVPAKKIIKRLNFLIFTLLCAKFYWF